jgi:MerR family transcriptional regulator, light-induced transcriptional regulator
MSETEAGVQVGELARNVGVSPETLRAWERRYGVLNPERTEAGYRVYRPEDEARARRMVALIADGLPAARAARTIADESFAVAPDLEPSLLAELLRVALLGFDAERAHATIDRLLAAHPLPVVLEAAVLPVLREIGDGWAVGTISVAQEHFASELLGVRLRALSRGWEQGGGRRALLACPSGERHDLGLLCCGLALREQGWRVIYLGADTPDSALTHAVRHTRPDALVIGVIQSAPMKRAAGALSSLGGEIPVMVGGAGARDGAGWERLTDGPVAAAAAIAARGARPPA